MYVNGNMQKPLIWAMLEHKGYTHDSEWSKRDISVHEVRQKKPPPRPLKLKARGGANFRENLPRTSAPGGEQKSPLFEHNIKHCQSRRKESRQLNQTSAMNFVRLDE